MMRFEWKYFYRNVCALIVVGASTYLFSIPWLKFVSENNNTGFLLGLGNIGMALGLYFISFSLIGHFIGAFKIGVTRKASVMASNVLTAFSVDFLEIFFSVAITGNFRFFFDFAWRYAILFVVQSFFQSLFVIVAVSLYRKIFPPLRLLEICGDRNIDLKSKMESIPSKYHIEEIMDYHEGIEKIKDSLSTYDGILIADIPSHEQNQIIKLCVDHDKRVYFIPKIGDVIVRYSEELNIFDTPLYLTRPIGIGILEGCIKRCFDVLVSFVSLIVLSPVLIITAIAIKAEDGGPAFFRQERVTIGGKKFMILKFRSMIVDAEKDGRPHPAGEKDDRITKVGKIIRATRIDELPQLLNILKGDMSIVGPRPERVEHVEMYTRDIPEFTFRSKVKGGLTGYAQVYGKYNTTALDKLKMDLTYIMHFSLLLDLQILFETLKIIFQKESTEGFSEERVEEMHNGGMK